jgi:hypothetical protein
MDEAGGPPLEADGADDGPEAPQGSGGRRRLVLLVVAVVVLVAAGILAVTLLGDDDDDVTADSATTTETVGSSADEDDDAAAGPDEPPVDDGSTASTTSTEAAEPEGGAEPVEVAAGLFVSLDYEVSGGMRVLEQPDGSHVVRLEDLASEDGPALYLYLSTNPAGGPREAFKDDFVDLGSLQATAGTYDYPVPPGVDLSRFASVVIWCEQVSAPFGAADLVAA